MSAVINEIELFGGPLDGSRFNEEAFGAKTVVLLHYRRVKSALDDDWCETSVCHPDMAEYWAEYRRTTRGLEFYTMGTNKK